MPLDPQTLRLTMRHWVAGVTVVTSVHHAERAGMTVSSFTSVSLEPPTVLVCLNKETYTHKLVMDSKVFAISMLGAGQESISNAFAGLDPNVVTSEDRFKNVQVATAETGAPLLHGAVGWLDCVVRITQDTWTHTVFIGEVVYAWANPDKAPLVYYDRSYQILTPAQTK
jgi:flavin reductase (DIM6/NTAB) family NADH-FMN oxidoreductase RutF